MKARQTKELERICAYCEHATLLAESNACVCAKRGIVRTNECCRRYRPDLLKLQPLLPRLPEEQDGNLEELPIES